MVTATPVAKQKTSWTDYVATGFAVAFGLFMLLLGVLLVVGYIADHRGGK